MPDRHTPPSPSSEYCHRCGALIQRIRIDLGRGIVRWQIVDPVTGTEHTCENLRVRG